MSIQLIDSSPATVHDIREYGARGLARPGPRLYCAAREHAGWRPGNHLEVVVYDTQESGEAGRADTVALQQAIDTAAELGGGCVWVPAGDYLIEPILLRSRVRLHLAAGATLWGVPRLEPYERAAGNTAEHDMTITSDQARPGGLAGQGVTTGLLEAVDCEQVSLTGEGCIHQQGGAFSIPWWTAEKAYPLRRPCRMLRFLNCRQVRVEGVRIRHSAGWTLTFEDCEDVRVRDISLRNIHCPNADGIDIVDSRNVVVQGCDIFTTDDGICLKSHRPSGLVENVHVSGCFIRTLCNGFKIGTETLGTIRHVIASGLTVYNPENDMNDAQAAVAICCMDGGVVEGISLWQVRARNVQSAFYCRLGQRDFHQRDFRPARAGSIRDIRLADIHATGTVLPAFVSGLPGQPVRDFRVDGLHIEMSNATEAASPAEIPNPPEAYPKPLMFGPLPACGLYARHISGLSLRDFAVKQSGSDPRPALVHESVEGLRQS